MIEALVIVAAYLAGSVSTAVLLSRLMGLPDPRTAGSGNPGATNVLRLGGRKAAALTLAGDVLKGLVPVLVARWLTDSTGVAVLSAIAAFLGHLYPVFLGFKGGKGVATALGALGALAWPLGLAVVVVWAAVAAGLRYASLASITAAVFAPLLAAWLDQPVAVVLGVAVMSTLLCLRHSANVSRLVAGEESRIRLGGGRG